ncbi:regulatory protein RecX [Bacteroidota bacterium]
MSTEQNTISAIVQKKNKSSCIIYINSNRFIELSLDIILKYRLGKGTILNKTLEEKIICEQRIIDLKQAAYNFASYKPRTCKQIRNKMKQKGFADNEIVIAIAFLSEFNLLNDEKYAITFAKEYIKRKPCGKPKIINELMNRGISKELSEEAAAEAAPEEEIYELAKAAGEKKLRSIQYKSREKQKQSLISYLQRQGFNWDIIKQVSNELLQQ